MIRYGIPRNVASQVFDLLVKHAEANESDRDSFLHAQERGCTEYRFCGSLGFGGKFWDNAGRWYVTCYSEDETPARLTAIDATNTALAALRESVGVNAADNTRSLHEHVSIGSTCASDQLQEAVEILSLLKRPTVHDPDTIYGLVSESHERAKRGVASLERLVVALQRARRERR